MEQTILKLIVEIAVAVLGVATATVVAMSKIKEAKIRKKDPTFMPNPKRCEEERDRINALEGQNKVWLTRFDHVDDSLAEIKGSLKTLTDLHLKG